MPYLLGLDIGTSGAKALLVLLLTGFFAGLYPAAAAIRLPVAGTLREEML